MFYKNKECGVKYLGKTMPALALVSIGNHFGLPLLFVKYGHNVIKISE